MAAARHPVLMRRRLGIIGGTGLYSWPGPGESIDVETPYGEVAVTFHATAKGDIVFVPRHGKDHSVPPHRVNSRAQLWAMKASKVDAVLGVFNVGSLDPATPPGRWMLWDDLVDHTKSRLQTFDDGRVVHVDLSPPFCPRVRDAFLRQAPSDALSTGVYVATEGPRFETAAEAAQYRREGGTVAGMTAVPEVPLARELGVCYVPLARTANGSGESVSLETIQRRMATARPGLAKWVAAVQSRWPAKPACDCAAKAKRAVLGGGVRA